MNLASDRTKIINNVRDMIKKEAEKVNRLAKLNITADISGGTGCSLL